MKKTSYITLAFMIGIIPFLFSQNNMNISGLDSLRIQLQKQLTPNIPGAAILITYQDSIIFEEYYGLANLETKEELNADRLMGIASMSKQFVGMSILILENKGLLSINDDIKLYLPELPLDGREITIRQLLSHVSGLPEITQNDAFMQHLDQKRTPEQIIDMAFTQEFRHEPGERYQYCNTAYTILVTLIEKISHETYQDFINTQIFTPLHMQHTYSCDSSRDAENIATRYLADSSGYLKAEAMHFSNLIGGGGIVSNVRDMMKWNTALLSGTNLPPNYQELWEATLLNTGESTNYGLGLGISEFNEQVFYYHPGMGSGMNSINLLIPDQNFSITIIRNISKPKLSSVQIALLSLEYLF